MFVRAAEGRTVRRPDTLTLLRPEGEEVPDTDFWFRRLSEGDVERGDPNVSSEAEPAAGEDEPPTEGDPEALEAPVPGASEAAPELRKPEDARDPLHESAAVAGDAASAAKSEDGFARNQEVSL